MSLTFAELREKNVERSKIWHKGGLEEWSLSDWAVALAGEVGEACDVIKKLNRCRDGIVGNKKSEEELLEALELEEELLEDLELELADIQLYLDLLAARADINLGEVTRYKFNQVSDRLGFEIKL